MTDRPPPGYYLASDGQHYPVPPGQYLASDGRLYPIAAAPGAAPATAAGSAWRWTPGVVCVLAGSVAAVIGSFLPWANAGPFSVAGTDGDGALTLVLGAAAGALGGAANGTKKIGFAIGSLVTAALVVVIAAIDIGDVASLADNALIEVEVGGGLVLTLLGGGAAMVGAVLQLLRR
jgi:hypothetical protein